MLWHIIIIIFLLNILALQILILPLVITYTNAKEYLEYF